MTGPTVELLRRAFEDFARGDIDALVAACHPRGSLSGAEVESQFGHVYEFVDGKIVRAAYYLDERRALQAAGAEHAA